MDSKQTCETCKHWQRKPWPNGLGWHGQGTCAVLRLSGQQIVETRPAFESMIGSSVATNAAFGCSRWEGGEVRPSFSVSIQGKDFVDANNAALLRCIEGMKL